MSARLAASLTTWFSAPPLTPPGSFEVLARASCFLVAAPRERLVLLASAHVSHPHRHQHLFPRAPFLAGVRDAALRYSVELRDGAGVATARVRLPPRAAPARHAARDAAALALPRAAARALLAALPALAPARLARARAPPRARLRAEGHFLAPARDAATGDDTSALLPRAVRGALLARSAAQAFVETEEVLEMGMCGGPVVLEEGEDAGAVAGLVEGIVPAGAPDDAPAADAVQARARALLGGKAVMVEVDELRQLVDDALRECGGDD